MFKDAVRTLGRLVPPIRRLHDAALREHTGRMAAEAGIGRLRAEVEAQKGKPQIPVPDQEREQYARWANLKSRQQLIEIDFPVNPKARFGYGGPPKPIVSKLLEASQSRYEANIRALLPLVGPVVTIPPHPIDNAAEPNWQNPSFPALDAIAALRLYRVAPPEPLRRDRVRLFHQVCASCDQGSWPRNDDHLDRSGASCRSRCDLRRGDPNST